MEKGLVTIEEAAEWLSMGRTATYALIASGRLASVYIGRSRRVPVAALRAFVAQLAEDGRAA